MTFRPRRDAATPLVRCVAALRVPLPAIAAVLLLQGCALGPTRGGEPADAESLDRVAQNLVFTLAQLRGLNPLGTTVQLSEPRTAFGEAVVRRIRDVGYGVQSVPDDRGANYLRYRIQRTASEAVEETRYSVSIGDVSIERAYDLVDDRFVPVSPQRVTGATTAATVELNDDLFGLDPDATVSLVAYDADVSPQVVDVSSGEIEPPVRDAAGADGFGARVKQNLYTRLSSNYADLFASYDDVDTHDLVFPNDSMRLGPEQKAIIADYAARVDPETDLVSVVGCSHGRTAIDNGNSVLAIGRANRVKEALVFAGVSPETVLDEGCWADSYHTRFPKRGVVMTLKRRRG